MNLSRKTIELAINAIKIQLAGLYAWKEDNPEFDATELIESINQSIAEFEAMLKAIDDIKSAP